MGWELSALSNIGIAQAYLVIAGLILRGLWKTRQLTTNPLALATAAIFLTCAAHHAHHAVHLIGLPGTDPYALAAVRSSFGEWHSVAIDATGLVVAFVYVGLRHSYATLLNTPAMFDDAVRSATEAQLLRLAYTDQLTGLDNRAAYQALSDALEDERAPERRVTLLFLDLDGFKAVNDRHGHEAGDRLLSELGGRLAGGALSGERVFRMGGDEFVVVAFEAQVDQLLARYLALAQQPFQLRDETLMCRVSAGASTGTTREALDQLLRRADRAMYDVKLSRKAVVVAPQESDARPV